MVGKGGMGSRRDGKVKSHNQAKNGIKKAEENREVGKEEGREAGWRVGRRDIKRGRGANK